MIAFRRVFLDTAPIIYYLERNEEFYPIIKNFFLRYSNAHYFTSAVTVAEYLTFPYRKGDNGAVDRFYKFLDEMYIDLLVIDKETANKAAKIRGQFYAFKTMDSIQLASACLAQCDLFLTNDRQLLQFQEIQCMTLDSFRIENRR